MNRVPPSACLNCGSVNDACTNANVGDDHGPRPGDFTICWRCGHLMVFADDLTMRKPNGVEMLIIAGDPRLLSVQRARTIALQEAELHAAEAATGEETQGEVPQSKPIRLLP